MLDRLGLKEFVTRSFLIISLLGFTALWYSPFIVSLATVLSFVFLLIDYKRIAFMPKWIQYTSLGILSITVLEAGLSGFHPISIQKFTLILGFCFVLFAGFHFYTFKKKWLIHFLLVLASVVCIVNIFAVSNYLMHKTELDQMLLQSKSIPILNMHHIHFGIINAVTIVGLVGVLFLHNLDTRITRIALFLSVLIFISLHILSSRTGLIAFYMGCFSALVVYTKQSNSLKTLAIGLGLFIAITFISYNFSTSFHNKVSNSIEDIQSWGKGDEINHKSMAMRIEAYKTCIDIIKKEPFGTGSHMLEESMQSQYIDNHTVLYKENRMGPHNQFLEYGVKYGILGVLLVLLFFYSLVRELDLTLPNVALISILFVAMIFESLLERQASLFFIALFIPLFYHLFDKKLTNGI